jgi:hypothetical protein
MKETNGISADRFWIYAPHGSNFKTSPQRKRRRRKYHMLPFLVVNDISFRILNKILDLKKIVYLPISEQRDSLWPNIFRIVDKGKVSSSNIPSGPHNAIPSAS